MATVRKRTWRTAAGEPRSAWVADYFDQNRRRHEKTFSTQKAAKAWLVETQGEVARGVHTPERNSVTLAEAAQMWLERGQAERLERGTLRGYTALVRLHIAADDSGIGAVKLAQLSTPMLEGWRDRLLVKRSRRLSRSVLGTLKAILAEAQRRGLVAQNPALPVKIDTRKRDSRKLEIGRDVPDKVAVQSLLAACTGPFARHRPFIVTAIFTGMRASELRGLPWSAVDFGKKTITVRQRADEWGTLGNPKSHAGQREIPMAGYLLNTLHEWKLACPNGELDLVFPNGRGNVERFSNLTCRVCGIRCSRRPS